MVQSYNPFTERKKSQPSPRNSLRCWTEAPHRLAPNAAPVPSAQPAGDHGHQPPGLSQAYKPQDAETRTKVIVPRMSRLLASAGDFESTFTKESEVAIHVVWNCNVRLIKNWVPIKHDCVILLLLPELLGNFLWARSNTLQGLHGTLQCALKFHYSEDRPAGVSLKLWDEASSSHSACSLPQMCSVAPHKLLCSYFLVYQLS